MQALGINDTWLFFLRFWLNALKLPLVSQNTQWLQHKQWLVVTQNCNKLYLMWQSGTPQFIRIFQQGIFHTVTFTLCIFFFDVYIYMCSAYQNGQLLSHHTGAEADRVWNKPDTLLHLIKDASQYLYAARSVPCPCVDICWCRNIHYNDFCATIWIMYTVLQFKACTRHLSLGWMNVELKA